MLAPAADLGHAAQADKKAATIEMEAPRAAWLRVYRGARKVCDGVLSMASAGASVPESAPEAEVRTNSAAESTQGAEFRFPSGSESVPEAESWVRSSAKEAPAAGLGPGAVVNYTTCMPPLVHDAVQEFARLVRQAFADRVLDLRLFGSWARGEAHEDSDVDVFVLLEGATRQDQRVILDIAAGIFTARGIDISPLVMPPEVHDTMVEHERRLVRDIETEGVAL